MDRRELAFAAWFHKIESIGSKTLFTLQEQFGSMEEAYKAGEKALCAILKPKQYIAFKAAKYAMSPDWYLESIEEQGIRYVTYYDEIYPERLLHIPDAPFGIFVKGSLPKESEPSVAMIGARACSEYGKEVARLFSERLALAGIQVISGMARGIDSVSQSACIRAGGRTFAVLGSGVDVCYPEELHSLYEEIMEHGGIISAYPPGAAPLARNFPPRNRIISGLSDVVVVVESRHKSGTLITVDMALEQGREVAVVPGRITDDLSRGCHALIKQGATAVLDDEQLVELVWENFYVKWDDRREKGDDAVKDSTQKDAETGDLATKSAVAERVMVPKDAMASDWACQADTKRRAILSTLSPEILSIYNILEQDPKDPEILYQKWLAQGAAGSLSTLLEGLMDLELMDLCKSHKNQFSIR